ncbi:MAG TPA: SCP2 sterol-binding domain-containing protein [Ktedonobacteraceae bacterium]|nr:SCP2 sterol-binding domain-containing protein [Ktedonobacteraceae bacterium]
MATREELREAIDDYVAQARKSERVLRSLRNWNCVIYFEANDTADAFTMVIKNGSTEVYDVLHETPDLIVRGSSEDLADIFWGDANPASNYMQGAIKVQGSQENVMRLDAMAMLIYLEVNK